MEQSTIETIAPIEVAKLKDIFKDKEKVVTIDVDGSKLAPKILLVYLTNLGLNIRFKFQTAESYFACLKAYFSSPMLHSFPQLEYGAIEVLLQLKGFSSDSGMDYSDLIDDEELKPVLFRWLNIIESLSIYNMRWYTSDYEATTYDEAFPRDNEKDLVGINFVNLISYDQFSILLADSDPQFLRYYTHFYDNPVFKGNTLAPYWTHSTNPVFSITLAMNEGRMDGDIFEEHFQNTVNDLVG